MSEFKFNQYGVCTNPEVLGEVAGNRIYVARSEVNGWLYGYSWDCDNHQNGGGYAPSIQNIEKNIKSKREAVAEAIKALKKIAERESRQGFGVQNITECCNKAFDEVNQMSLF